MGFTRTESQNDGEQEPGLFFHMLYLNKKIPSVRQLADGRDLKLIKSFIYFYRDASYLLLTSFQFTTFQKAAR